MPRGVGRNEAAAGEDIRKARHVGFASDPCNQYLYSSSPWIKIKTTIALFLTLLESKSKELIAGCKVTSTDYASVLIFCNVGEQKALQKGN